MVNNEVALIGYSGHAYVVAEILKASGYSPAYYCEQVEKDFNPYGLHYLGKEQQATQQLKKQACFIAIGDNLIRRKIFEELAFYNLLWINALHPSAFISDTSVLSKVILVGPGSIINAQSRIGTGTICNSGAIVEHECVIGDFVHIAPGAVLCGNVQVGENSFIGANAVVKQGIYIGKNVVIGAGAVVVKNVPDNSVLTGNPAKLITY